MSTGDWPDIIRLEQVTKTYERPYGEEGRAGSSDGIRVLQGIDLAVAPGEFVALMGPSGCGKSTLLNLVAGIDRPTGGRVYAVGRCLSSLNETDLTRYRREAVGVIYQFFHLLPTLTAAENVALPLLLNRIPRPEAERRADEILVRVGMANRSRHLPSELSGGELQRVALARAVVHRPRLLLADEPTGNLDSPTGAALMAHLRSLAEETGLTILLATHSGEIAGRADRTVHLRDGKLRHSRPRTAG